MEQGLEYSNRFLFRVKYRKSAGDKYFPYSCLPIDANQSVLERSLVYYVGRAFGITCVHSANASWWSCGDNDSGALGN